MSRVLFCLALAIGLWPHSLAVRVMSNSDGNLRPKRYAVVKDNKQNG